MNALAEKVADRFVVASSRTAGEPLPETDDPQVAFEAIMVFNTILAKLCQKLKRDAGATTIAQNYKGTGKQAFRRQLYVRFSSGAIIDLWLEKNYLGLGGVVRNSPPGAEPKPMPKGVPYKNHTPEQVYAEVAALLKEWANP